MTKMMNEEQLRDIHDRYDTWLREGGNEEVADVLTSLSDALRQERDALTEELAQRIAAQAERDALRAQIDNFKALVLKTRDELAVNAALWQTQRDADVAALTEARRVLREAQPHLEVLMRSTNAGTVRDARRMLLSQIADVLAQEGQ